MNVNTLFFLIILILYSGMLSAKLPKITPDAVDKSKEAVLAHPQIKQYKSNGETEIYRKLKNDWGIEKDVAVTTVAIGYSVSQGEVTTRHFKKIGYRQKDFTIRPETTYKYRDKQADTAITFNWSF